MEQAEYLWPGGIRLLESDKAFPPGTDAFCCTTLLPFSGDRICDWDPARNHSAAIISGEPTSPGTSGTAARAAALALENLSAIISRPGTDLYRRPAHSPGRSAGRRL